MKATTIPELDSETVRLNEEVRAIMDRLSSAGCFDAPPEEGLDTNSFPPYKEKVGKESNFCPLSASDLLAEEPEPMPWIWSPFIAEGTLNLLVSFMKVGKSTMAYPLAIAVAQGRSFLGYPTRQGGVLILAVEEHKRDVKRRLRRFGLQPGDPLQVHSGPLTNSPATFEALRQFITDNAIKLVILDTLPRFWSVEDENANADVMRQTSPFLDLARTTGAAILLLHHERKSGGENGRAIRGGGALFGLVDQALMLDRRQGGGSEKQRVLRASGRYDETPAELILELVENEYRNLGTAEELNPQIKAETAWEALTDAGDTVQAIAAKAGLTERETRNALELLGDRVTREGEGKKGNPYTYRRAPQNSIPSKPSPIGEETNSDLEQVELEPPLEEVHP